VTDGGTGKLVLAPRTINPPSGLGMVQMLSDRWSSRQNDSFHVWFEIDVTSTTPVCRKAVAVGASLPPV
jgi:hypothetical protein